MKILLIVFLIAGVLAISNFEKSFGETVTKSMDAGMSVELTYPDTIFPGREFTISILVKNEGWEDKQNIQFLFSSDKEKISSTPDAINIEKISSHGTVGKSLDFLTSNNITAGTYYINVKYFQTLLANNKDPQEPFTADFALPIIIKERPSITIHTISPESIFANAEFPLNVEVTSNDIDITNVRIEIISPSDITFRGETQHNYSIISKDQQISFSSRIVTVDKEVTNEHILPFEIKISYQDDLGNEKTDSQTVKIVLRPRSMLEITTDGGIWIGGFFLAPYISIGTIIGIPAGAIFSLVIKKAQKTKGKKKSKK